MRTKAEIKYIWFMNQLPRAPLNLRYKIYDADSFGSNESRHLSSLVVSGMLVSWWNALPRLRLAIDQRSDFPRGIASRARKLKPPQPNRERFE